MEVVVALDSPEQVGGHVRLLGLAAVVYASIWPLLQIAVVGADPGTAQEAAIAGAATAVYLPLYCWLVLCAVRNERARRGPWVLAALALVIIGVTPALGANWLPAHHVLAVAALLVLRRPWSWIACLALVLSEAVWGQALDHVVPDAPAYYAITVVWRAASVFVPLWLATTAVQLEATRRALADQAVVRERLRIDDELRASVAPPLAAIVQHGTELARLDPDRCNAEDLQLLVDGSRRTLADVRRLMRSYQQVSVGGELETAVVLLQAAGVDSWVDLDLSSRHLAMDDRMRADLNAAVADLLRHESTARCGLGVEERGGRLRIVVHPASGHRSSGSASL